MLSPRDPNWTGHCISECAQCGAEIYAEYPFVKDGEDNCFCDESCAIEYHGIKTVDFDDLAPCY